MLDKSDQLGREPVIVDGKELAIGAHLTAALGQTRQLDLSCAIPLGWTDEEVNATLDRLASAINRQKARQDLEATKSMLLNAETDLHNNRVHRADQENQFILAHANSNKRGDWNPTGSQRQSLNNLDVNIKNAEERISKLRKDIVELEEKCR